MIIKQILTRIYVNDMNAAIDFYERLTNEKCANWFEYKQLGLEIARINNLLIISGTDKALEPFKGTSATFLLSTAKNRNRSPSAKRSNSCAPKPTSWSLPKGRPSSSNTHLPQIAHRPPPIAH